MIQINKIRDEMGNITDTEEIQKTIKIYLKNPYSTKFEYLKKWIISGCIPNTKVISISHKQFRQNYNPQWHSNGKSTNWKRAQGQMVLAHNSTRLASKSQCLIFPNYSTKENEKEQCPICFEATVILILKLQKLPNKENCKPTFLINTDAKVLNKIFANRI